MKHKLFTLLFALIASTAVFAIGNDDGSTQNFRFNSTIPPIPGESYSAPINLVWDTIDHHAESRLWYAWLFDETNVPDTYDIRLHFTNLSTEEDSIAADIYFDSLDPVFFYGKNNSLAAGEDDYIDVDRRFMEMIGWATMLMEFSSTKDTRIWAELIPDIIQYEIRDTIVAYVCEGDYYDDSPVYYQASYGPIDSFTTWNDTIPFNDGLIFKDSVYIFQIHPLVLPEPLSVDRMKTMGVAPSLVQGMPLEVEPSNTLLTQYYRNLADEVDSIAYIDTVYWAKPVYRFNDFLDDDIEDPLNLNSPYPQDQLMDTLLLVIHSSECYVTSRTPYIFPIEPADSPSDVPAVDSAPVHSVMRLIRNGNVFILKDDEVYTIHGQRVNMRK